MFPKLSKWEKYLKNMEQKRIKNPWKEQKDYITFVYLLQTQFHISPKYSFRSVFKIFLKQIRWQSSASMTLIKKASREMNKVITPY